MRHERAALCHAKYKGQGTTSKKRAWQFVDIWRVWCPRQTLRALEDEVQWSRLEFSATESDQRWGLRKPSMIWRIGLLVAGEIFVDVGIAIRPARQLTYWAFFAHLRLTYCRLYGENLWSDLEVVITCLSVDRRSLRRRMFNGRVHMISSSSLCDVIFEDCFIACMHVQSYIVQRSLRMQPLVMRFVCDEYHSVLGTYPD